MDTFTFRNNTFESEVALESASVVNSKMVGNIGIAATCKSGVAYSYNVWTQRTCGSTDRQASNVKSYFQNPAAHDWRLKAGSPAIDRATRTTTRRPTARAASRNGLPDAGAYEYGGGASTPTRLPLPLRTGRRHAGACGPAGNGVDDADPDEHRVRWNATTDNIGVTGYRLYRNGTLAGTTTGTSYSVTGLACGTSYTIGLTAVDAAGNESYRAEASGTTAPPPARRTTPRRRPRREPHGQRRHGHLDPAQLDRVDRQQRRGLVRGVQGRDSGRDATGTSYTVTGITDCSTTPALSVRAVDAAGNVSGRPSRTIRCTWQ